MAWPGRRHQLEHAENEQPAGEEGGNEDERFLAQHETWTGPRSASER